MKQTGKTAPEYRGTAAKRHIHLSESQVMTCADPSIKGEEKAQLLMDCSHCEQCSDRILTVVRALRASSRGRQNSEPFERARFAVAKNDRKRRRIRTLSLAAASFVIIAGAGLFLVSVPSAKKDPLAMQVTDNKTVVTEMAHDTSAKQKKRAGTLSLKRSAGDAGYSFFLLRNGAAVSKTIEETVVSGISDSTRTGQNIEALKDGDFDDIIRAVNALPETAQNEFRDGYLAGLLSHAVKSGSFEGEKKKELIELMLLSSSEQYRSLGKRFKDGDPAAADELIKMLNEGRK